MKKFFLPLLALVGMVAGFTLCSCGGGGGNSDGPARALTGMEIQVADTPWVTYSFGAATSGNCVFVDVIAGGYTGGVASPSSQTDVLTAKFYVESVRPSNGGWSIQGRVSFASVVTEMQKAQEFLAYIGVPSDNTESVTLGEYVLRLDFAADSDDGGQSYTAIREGTYWIENATEGTAITQTQKKAPFEVLSGKLKTEYLGEQAGGDAGDIEWQP